MIVRLLTCCVFFLLSGGTYAAKVDTIAVFSASMQTTYKAAVALPESYSKNKSSYPVLYLLHGGLAHFDDWLKLTPDKMAVKNLADQYNIIIVMPEGEELSWYINSPFSKSSQFETHITKEVIPLIDETYRTVKSNSGRVIAGFSMGGHGALYISSRNPGLFCAVGSMSGSMDMNWKSFRIDRELINLISQRFQTIFGTSDPGDPIFVNNSIINMTETIRKSGLPIIIDCGVDDFLIEANRELHRRLIYNGTPHEYTERPGGHTWTYWQEALPFQVLFLYQVLRKNGVTVK